MPDECERRAHQHQKLASRYRIAPQLMLFGKLSFQHLLKLGRSREFFESAPLSSSDGRGGRLDHLSRCANLEGHSFIGGTLSNWLAARSSGCDTDRKVGPPEFAGYCWAPMSC